jgi:hypothetical protein
MSTHEEVGHVVVFVSLVFFAVLTFGVMMYGVAVDLLTK